MSYDPNQPSQPPYGAPNQPPYGTPNQPSQPPYGIPNQPPPYGIPNQPQQPQYGIPPYTQPQELPQKKSRKRLWTILGIVGGILVLACGGCAIMGALGIGFFAKTVAGPISSVDQYYKAIESQDYNTAYSHLQVDNFTLGSQTLPANATIFTQLANVLDSQRGKVTKYSITSTNVNNDTATVTVSVTRRGPPYTVTLNLKQVGNDWKIVRLDNI